MNSTEGDISATRKSSRTRLKRDFGTDFIDPTTVRISDKTNRTSDVKRKVIFICFNSENHSICRAKLKVLL